MRCDRFARVALASARRLGAALLLFTALARIGHTQMPEHEEMMKWGNTLFIMFEQLEYSPLEDSRPASLEARMWYGGAFKRVWLRSEGERSTAGDEAEAGAELQLLYGKLIDPYWDAVIGLRGDRQWENGDSRGRVLLAFGLLGLAPYRFELEPTVFVGPKGELSARLDAAFPLLLTQRLVLEPRVEIDAAMQAAPRYGVRRGVGEYEMGLRLRYEIKREFAPYVGWTRSRERDPVGETGVRLSAARNRLVFGLRVWR